MTHRAIVLTALVLLSACVMTSAHPSTFEPAQGPHGVNGLLRVGSETYAHVELLAVQDSAYVVMNRGRVAFAPFRFVSHAQFQQIALAVPTDGNRVPGRDVREQLRYASRFPYGIPAPAMAALLQQAGQQAPDTLGVTVRR